MTLFDGTAPASVVYGADAGVPIAKVAALLGHDLQAPTGWGLAFGVMGFPSHRGFG